MSKLYTNNTRTFAERVKQNEVCNRTLYLAIYENGLRIGQTLRTDINIRFDELIQSEKQEIISDKCKELGKIKNIVKIITVRGTFDTVERFGEEFLKEHLDKVRPGELHLGGRYDLE